MPRPKRIRSFLKGKTYEEFFGKKKALEIKQRKSKSLKGKKKSPEHCAAISKYLKTYYRNGGKPVGCFKRGKDNYSVKVGVWNKGLTKRTNTKLRKIGIKIKETENEKVWKATIGKAKAEKISRIHKGKPSWNEGLTKYTDDRLKKVGKKIQKALLSRKGI